MHWDHQLTPHPAFHLRQAFGGQVGHPLPIGWGYVFSVAAAILAAVAGGILPPGKNDRFFRDPQSAGRLEELFRRAGCTGSTAGETPAATLNTYTACRRPWLALPWIRLFQSNRC